MTLKMAAPSYFNRINFIIKNIGSGSRVLNVGCGDGYVDRFLKKKFKKVYSIDINKSDLKIAKSINPEKNVIYKEESASNLPFKNDFFDAVVCTELIEHIPDDKKVIKEIYRVLKKNGRLMLTIPHKKYNFSYDPINYIYERLLGNYFHFGMYGFGHLRLYTEENIIGLLADFKNVNIKKDLHFFNGIFENTYILNLLQPLVKSDPKNLTGSAKDLKKLKKNVIKDPPKFMQMARSIVIWADRITNISSKKGFQLLAACRK